MYEDLEPQQYDDTVAVAVHNCTCNYFYVMWSGVYKTGCRRPNAGDTDKISYWDEARQKRYSCKTGRFLKKFWPELNDGAVELVAADINTELFAEAESCVKLLEGEDIREAYFDCVGGGSCMTHDYTQKYLDIYVDHPDRCKLTVAEVTKGNKIQTARALYWICDRVKLVTRPDKRKDEIKVVSEKSFKYGDRIYYTSPEARNVLRAWHNEHADLTYRQHFNQGENPPGGHIQDICVPFTKWPDYWPYFDSFRFVTQEGQKLFISSPVTCYEACSTEGDLFGFSEERHYCCYCDERATDVEEFDGDYWCSGCANEYLIYCDHCENRVHIDNTCSLHILGISVCEDCRSTYFERCDYCGEYFEQDSECECDEAQEAKNTALKDKIETINKES